MGNTLALDQSSRTTGYCIGSPTGEIISYGQKNFASLQEQYHFFSSLLGQHAITTLVIEDTFMGANTTTYKTLCEVIGMFKTLAFLNDLELYIYPAASWRRKVNLRGKGRTEVKRAAVAMVDKLYGIKVAQDTSEAILIYKAYMAEHESAFQGKELYVSFLFFMPKISAPLIYCFFRLKVLY